MNTSTKSLWAPVARFLANPSLVALVAFGISLIAIFYFLGEWLLPVIISIALAYLLEGVVGKLERIGVRRGIAVALVYFIFIAAILYLTIVLLPAIIDQAKLLIGALPDYFQRTQEYILLLPHKFPTAFSESGVQSLLDSLNGEIANFSKSLSGKLFYSVFVIIKVCQEVIDLDDASCCFFLVIAVSSNERRIDKLNDHG